MKNISKIKYRKYRAFRSLVAVVFVLGFLLPTALLLFPRDGVLPFCHHLYVNGRILTLNPQNDVSDAMLVSCGRVEWIGSEQGARQERRWYTRTIDLAGRTIIPGFVDAHSHFPLPGLADVAVDLNQPPMGATDSLARLYQQLREQTKLTDEGEWIFGFNYDNTAFTGGQHPDRKSLDAIAPLHPVFVRHSSGHMGVANSLGLELLGIRQDQTSAENPYIGKYYGSMELNGLLQESAAPSLGMFVRALSWRQRWHLYRSAVSEYLAFGYTTVQAGGVTASNARLLGWLSRLQQLPLRLVYWVNHDSKGYTLSDTALISNGMPLLDDEYFYQSAVKVYADGSPQGFTAYLSEPYHTVLSGEDSDIAYRGYPGYPVEKWPELIRHYWLRKMPLAIHTNGDAAIEAVLNAIERVLQDDPPLKSFPITLVHAQTLRRDQASRAARLGVEASFFIGHTFYWGDWHRSRSLGLARAENISPLQWAESAGLSYSLHSDAPVTSPSAIDMLWFATSRETRSGHVLGAHQQVSRLTALRALTIEAARQAGLDKHRGSLEVGKVADFVVLSDDPLGIGDIRDLQVMETFVGGRCVYRR